MRSVIQQRGFCKSQITRAHNNATKFVEDIQSIPTLVARLAQLQDNYLRFVRLTEDLYAYESEEGWEDPAEDVDIYEEKHYATYAILSNTLEDLRLKSLTILFLFPINHLTLLAEAMWTFQEIMRIGNIFRTCSRHRLHQIRISLIAKDFTI